MFAFFNLIFLLIGFIALWHFSNKTVYYSAIISKSLGMSQLFTGFILLAASTGLPEILVAIQSIILNEPTLSTSVIIGTNFVNMSLALGIPALFIGPIYRDPINYKRQVNVLVLSSILTAFILIAGKLNPIIGVILIITYLLGIILIWRSRKISNAENNMYIANNLKISTTKAIFRLAIYLILLILSAHICVELAILLVKKINISLNIIGAFIFSLGTTLPDISLNIQATRQKQYSLAIGNALGSIFGKSSLVLGLLPLISSQTILVNDLNYIAPFLFFSYTIVTYSILFKKKITRLYGLILILSYIIFVLYEFISIFISIKNA